jgi:endonuclease/exonuclease/phosphatase family metal-dependent hydrolase
MNAPRSALVLAVMALLALAAPAHALKIATWNLWAYPDSMRAIRQPNFRTVMAGLDPDVIVVQEVSNPALASSADTFMNVLRAALPGRVWKLGNFSPGTESAVCWDSLKVTVTGVFAMNTGGPRQVLYCTVKPLGYTSVQAQLRLYSIHFKAGNTASDISTRGAEAATMRSLMNAVNLANTGPNFIIAGDSNIYTADEAAYLRLTESQADNDGRCRDPLVMPGNWHVNPSYAAYDTQCPCSSGCLPGFSGGGMDDRFDIMLTSYALQDGQGFDLVPPASGGYVAYGNDGYHFNTDINGSSVNYAVGYTIATALHDASDHLPVVITLQVPARVVATSAIDFGRVLVGAAAQQSLAVSDGATAPADALTYSLAAPAGFTAPSGTFEATAGAAANLHTLGMSTVARGTTSGTLTLTSDAPDSLSKSVLLSGTVLAHAVASLDPASAVTDAVFDLGARPAGAWPDSAVLVYDLGFDALTARLSVENGVIVGGDGRFTLVGGFTPSLVGAGSGAWPVHFDDAGATRDTTYEATLTFTCADEALPGEAPAGPLTVTLRAHPLAGAGGVGGTPDALAFAPPQPNPFTGRTRFAFDLPDDAPVALDVFDLSGRLVARLVRGTLGAGHHEAAWDGHADSGGHASAGLYFARFSTPGLVRVTRLVLLP